MPSEYHRGFADATKIVKHLADKHLSGKKKDVGAFLVALEEVQAAVNEHEVADVMGQLGVA